MPPRSNGGDDCCALVALARHRQGARSLHPDRARPGRPQQLEPGGEHAAERPQAPLAREEYGKRD